MMNLQDIKDPSFLKDLNKQELVQLSADIREFLVDSDRQCAIWMAVWYRPLMGDVPDIPAWSSEQLGRLENLRRQLLTDMESDIRQLLKVK